MRRHGTWVILCVALLALLSSGALFTAAIVEPFRSSDRLFVLQNFAERARSNLTFDSTARAEYALDLLDRRLSDLAGAATTPAELVALARANASLDRAAIAVAEAPESRPGTLLRARLARMGERAISVQASLTVVPRRYAPTYERFHAKLATLRRMAADPTMSQAAFGRLAGIPLPFPDDATRRAAFVATASGEPFELRHGLFPLDGAHATLGCASCHADRPVADRPANRVQGAVLIRPVDFASSAPAIPPGAAGSAGRACANCHRPGQSADHPIGSCAVCHTTVSWSDVRFNHRTATVPNCLNCHLKDKPPFHSRDDCASCHNADSWGGLRFDHVKVGLIDCQACHAASRPSAHAQGQCSDCHKAGDDWQTVSASQPAPSEQDSGGQSVPADKPAESEPSPAATQQPGSFQHPTGKDLNCQGCHASTRPANHFPGQCSQCHTAGTAWKPARVNHQGLVDCQGCHAAKRPANHFPGQCSQCHTAGKAWTPARFSHQNAADCQGCHASRRPANHYPGQCSECHAPGANWRPVRFNHALAGPDADCQGCHASQRPANHHPGQCSECHDPGSNWKPVRFNHALAGANADCQGCHASQRPANHYPGQCSECHAAGANWQPVRFNHDLAGAGADCQRCHASQRPQGHSGGQCSACHNVNGWKPANFNHQAAGSGVDCQGCHEGQRPANHLQGQCSECHSAGTAWQPPTVSHTFPMNHHGADGSCTTCHPSATRDWTCFGCHDQGELERKHREEVGSDIVGRCMNCHPDGRKPND